MVWKANDAHWNYDEHTRAAKPTDYIIIKLAGVSIIQWTMADTAFSGYWKEKGSPLTITWKGPHGLHYKVMEK
jgi:hypothetical protein